MKQAVCAVAAVLVVLLVPMMSLVAAVGQAEAINDSWVLLNLVSENLTPDTIYETEKALDSKLSRLGLTDTDTWVVNDKLILVHIPGVDLNTAQYIVGRSGKFEIPIQTQNNESLHVLYGDAVESVDTPSYNRYGGWGVPFVLSEEGAQIFQKTAIDSGATKNPQAYEIAMYLDNDQIFSAPLAPELAASLNKSPSRNMVAETGSGDDGLLKAKELYVHLKEGELPVTVEVVFATEGKMSVAPS